MADDASSQPEQRPVGVACTPCRRSKMKCVSSDPETTTCDRCQRLHRNCVYELHRRGQWRRDHTGRRAERQHPSPEYTAGGHDDLMPQIQRFGLQTGACGSYSVSPRSEQASFTPGALDGTHKIGGPSVAPVAPVAPSANSFDLMEVTANTPTTQDPIELGLVSEGAAQVLYDTFFIRFNPTVGLLDPSTYTFQHTRTQSSFLLTVILTVASRILPPGLYESLRDHSESLLGGALVSCDTGIETVWAIVCMYHWKDADDSRRDILIGFASRLVASAGWEFAGWDEEHRRNMTDIELRRGMEQNRVCLVLATIDSRSLFVIGRPPAIQSLAHLVDSWESRELTDLTESTYRLGGIRSVSHFELMYIVRYMHGSFKEHRRNYPLDDEKLTESVDNLIDILNAWGDCWSNRSTEPLQVAIILLYRDYTCLYFNSRLLDCTAAGPQRQTTVDACLSNALGVLEQIYRIGEMAGLRYLWDRAYSMTAYAAMLIPVVIAYITEDKTMWKQRATEILGRVASQYFAAMGNPEGSAPSRVSVTMAAEERLLRALRKQLNPGVSDFGGLALGEGELDQFLELDFVASRYREAGLAAWSDPGIFLHAR